MEIKVYLRNLYFALSLTALKKTIEEEHTKFVNIWVQNTEDANLGNLNLFASNKAMLKNDDLISDGHDNALAF